MWRGWSGSCALLCLHAVDALPDDVNTFYSADDYARNTAALARRLAVSRQSIHSWIRNPDAPKRINGRWYVPSWFDFMRTHKLNPDRELDQSEVIAEVSSVLRNRLPTRVQRRKVQQLLAFIVPLLPAFFERSTSSTSSGKMMVVPTSSLDTF